MLAVALAAIPSLAVAQAAAEYAPLFGVRFGGAQHQAVYAGLARFSRVSPDQKTGFALEVEGGKSGGQIGLGVIGMVPMAAQVRIQAVGLRTWGPATDREPGQEFLGVESQFTLFIGASVGYYRRLHGSAPGDGRFTAIRFVIGR